MNTLPERESHSSGSRQGDSVLTGMLHRIAAKVKPIWIPIVKLLCRRYPDLLLRELLASDATRVLHRALEHAQTAPKPASTALSHTCLRMLAPILHDTEVAKPLLELVHYATGVSMGYGQEGEDLILLRLLNVSTPGFFVDIGAHHPIRFSNTYTLYRAGWRGLNVDATPGCMELFRSLRPRDINVESAVSGTARPMLFHVFEEGALNTFDSALAAEYARQGWKFVRAQEITPWPLSDLLDEHLPDGQSIDLMNIDVEGEELSVLASNDWERYRPGTIVLEVLNTSLAHLEAAPTVKFLRGKGYVPVAKLLNSTILQLEA